MDKRRQANQQVKEKITGALLHLLGEKSISEISVTEIIAEAGVARASFYRNYATKESVITTLIADVLEDFRAGLPGDGEDFCTPENIRRSFAYFSRYAPQVLDMHRFGYGSILLERLNQFHEEVAGTMPCSSLDRYRLYIYIGALYNTAMMWLQGGQKESVEEIAGLFWRMCAGKE